MSVIAGLLLHMGVNWSWFVCVRWSTCSVDASQRICRHTSMPQPRVRIEGCCPPVVTRLSLCLGDLVQERPQMLATSCTILLWQLAASMDSLQVNLFVDGKYVWCKRLRLYSLIAVWLPKLPNATQVDWTTWAIWRAVKKYNLRYTCGKM